MHVLMSQPLACGSGVGSSLFRLEITMDDALFVHVFDGAENLSGVEACRLEVKRAKALDPFEQFAIAREFEDVVYGVRSPSSANCEACQVPPTHKGSVHLEKSNRAGLSPDVHQAL